MQNLKQFWRNVQQIIMKYFEYVLYTSYSELHYESNTMIFFPWNV